MNQRLTRVKRLSCRSRANGRVGSCCATAGLLPSLPLTTSARSRHRSTALTSWQRVGLCAYGACKAGRRGLGRGCRSSRRRNQRRTCCPEHAGAGSCARSGAFRSGGGGAGSDVAVLGERAQRGLARHHRGRCLPPVHCHANGMFGWRRIGWATRRHPCVRCLTADRHQRSAHRQPDQPVLRQRLSRRPRSLLQRGAARQGGSALHGRLRAVPRRSDAARSVAGADRRVPHRSPAPAPQDGHAGHIDACPFWGSCCCPNGRQRRRRTMSVGSATAGAGAWKRGEVLVRQRSMHSVMRRPPEVRLKRRVQAALEMLQATGDRLEAWMPSCSPAPNAPSQRAPARRRGRSSQSSPSVAERALRPVAFNNATTCCIVTLDHRRYRK